MIMIEHFTVKQTSPPSSLWPNANGFTFVLLSGRDGSFDEISAFMEKHKIKGYGCDLTMPTDQIDYDIQNGKFEPNSSPSAASYRNQKIAEAQAQIKLWDTMVQELPNVPVVQIWRIPNLTSLKNLSIQSINQFQEGYFPENYTEFNAARSPVFVDNYNNIIIVIPPRSFLEDMAAHGVMINIACENIGISNIDPEEYIPFILSMIDSQHRLCLRDACLNYIQDAEAAAQQMNSLALKSTTAPATTPTPAA